MLGLFSYVTDLLFGLSTNKNPRTDASSSIMQSSSADDLADCDRPCREGKDQADCNA